MELILKHLDYCKVVTKKPEVSWSTENEVLFKIGLCKLRRFKPFNNGLPILILPPNAGHHSSLADYSSTQSLVRLLQQHGFDVYVIEWLTATDYYKDIGIEDYIYYTDKAVNKIRSLSNYDKVSLIGQCQGGWQASIYTSLFNEKVDKLVVGASPIDFKHERGFMNDLIDYLPYSFYKYLVSLGNGIMKGDFIVTGFKNANYIDNYITKYLKLWRMILEEDKKGVERFSEFNDWYEYTQDLPGRFYLEVIDKIFKRNGMVNPGTIKIKNTPVDLKNINRPLILITGKKDDITPPGQCNAMALHVSTPKDNIKFLSADGGHIGTLMGRSALKNQWNQIAKLLKTYNAFSFLA